MLAKVSLDAGNVGFGLLVGAAGLGLTIGSFAAAGLRRSIRARAGCTPLGIALMASRLRDRGGGADDLGRDARRRHRRRSATAPPSSATRCSSSAARPDELRGRVFTVIMSSNYAVLGLGMASSPGRSPTRSARAGSGAARASPSWSGPPRPSCSSGGSIRARRPSSTVPCRIEPLESRRGPRGLDARVARGGRPRRRPAGARPRDLARRERRPARLRARPRALSRRPARAYVVGVTGPPGVGKSSPDQRARPARPRERAARSA